MHPGRVWIFDLDNTLHDARLHILPHIGRAMTAYMEQRLGIDTEAATRLRREYWRRYGATLLGMMRHHAIDPRDFLWQTHQFPDLARMVVHEPQLRRVLVRLPGRKLVFSNAPAHYLNAMLDVLKIADLFDDVMAVEHTGFRPKPDAHGFVRFLRRRQVPARRCIMVEDSLDNLRTAKKLGMKTVWVSRCGKAPGFVDVVVGRLAQLPQRLTTLD
ncbi:MAG TPA: pyrimidine 5'-nucleotidase [Burkholderiales bacterium]|nr:pyrimidine 5'-nucleotidase [Burkholderiales bacterium]